MNNLRNVFTSVKVFELFEEQLTFMKKQNEEPSIKLDRSKSPINKSLYGSKTEESKYQVPYGQALWLKTILLLRIGSRQRNKVRQRLTA